MGAFFVAIILVSSLFSQAPVTYPKGSYIDSAKRYYQQAELPIYLFIAHAPNDRPNLLAANLPQEPTIQEEIEPIYLEGHGKHHLKHKDVTQGRFDEYIIYADAIAPITKASYLKAAWARTEQQQYYGKNLVLELNTKDEMSGVRELFYSLNGASYTTYGDAILFDKEGKYTCQYYAIDQVGNVESIHRDSFIVDLSPPISYHNIVGINSDDIISISTKMYVTSTDSLSGLSKTFFRIDDDPWQESNGEPIAVSSLSEGEHRLSYYSLDQVGNQESVQSVSFFLDKSAPIMSADILGDKFLVDDKVYFSGRTKLKLMAIDNKSGLKDIQYSIDGEDFKPYGEPFYLPDQAGKHSIRYFAEDKLGNTGIGGRSEEKIGEIFHDIGVVYVDLNGPILTHKIDGPQFTRRDTLYIQPETEILFEAKDREAGVKSITYSLDQESEELPADAPIKVSDAGWHRMSYFGYDNVNNRNVEQISFVVDAEGPEIQEVFSVAPENPGGEPVVIPAYSMLFLTAIDKEIGAEKILYRINDAAETVYIGPVKGFLPDQEYNISVVAIDLLGNQTEKVIRFRTEKE